MIFVNLAIKQTKNMHKKFRMSFKEKKALLSQKF